MPRLGRFSQNKSHINNCLFSFYLFFVYLTVFSCVTIEVSKHLKPDNFRANIHYVHICDGCKSSTPLVILHGVGGAIPAYHKLYSTSVPQYGHLFKDRCIYSLDMPGFGLSTRLEFISESEIDEEREKLEQIDDKKKRQEELEKFESRIADECELKMVEEIEKWRVEMNINKMILLGHSFGGYISSAYATRYSKHVEQLVLLEP